MKCLAVGIQFVQQQQLHMSEINSHVVDRDRPAILILLQNIQINFKLHYVIDRNKLATRS